MRADRLLRIFAEPFASHHAAATGHSVIRSKAPGENCSDCYDDGVEVQINPL